MTIRGVDAVQQQLKTLLKGKDENSQAAAALFTQVTGEKASTKNITEALKNNEDFLSSLQTKELSEAQKTKIDTLLKEYKGKEGVNGVAGFLNTVTINYDNGATTTIFVNEQGSISKKITTGGKGKKKTTTIQEFDDLGRLKKKTIKNHKGKQFDEVNYKYYGKTNNLKERSETKGSGKDKIIRKTTFTKPKKDKDGNLVREGVTTITKNGKTTKRYTTDIVNENGKAIERSTYSDEDKKNLISKTTNNRAENGKLESKETIKYKDGKEDKKIVRENYRIENGRRCYDRIIYKAKEGKNGKISWEKADTKTIYIADRILNDIETAKKQREASEKAAAEKAAAEAAAAQAAAAEAAAAEQNAAQQPSNSGSKSAKSTNTTETTSGTSSATSTNSTKDAQFEKHLAELKNKYSAALKEADSIGERLKEAKEKLKQAKGLARLAIQGAVIGLQAQYDKAVLKARQLGQELAALERRNI